MTTELPDGALPLLPTTDDPTDTCMADPIVVPYHDILDPVVGRLTHVEVGHVDAETFAWAGVDDTGSMQSGTLRPDVGVGEDQRCITIGWRVEVDETPTG